MGLGLLNKKCSVCDSEKYVYFNERYGDFLCGKHKVQYHKFGKILERTRYDSNPIIEREDYCEVILLNNDCLEVGRALVDKSDLELVKKYKWCKKDTGYCGTNSSKYQGTLHQLLIGDVPEGFLIDHASRDKLDCRRNNLRIVTPSGNNYNRPMLQSNVSGVEGVYWHKTNDKWAVCIGINGETKHLGSFENFDEAVNVRRQAEQDNINLSIQLKN